MKSLIALLAMCVSLAACTPTTVTPKMWKDAEYACSLQGGIDSVENYHGVGWKAICVNGTVIVQRDD